MLTNDKSSAISMLAVYILPELRETIAVQYKLTSTILLSFVNIKYFLELNN